MVTARARLARDRRAGLHALTDQGRLFTRPIWLLAVAVLLGALAIDLATLSRHYSPDTMAFVMLTTDGKLTAPTFFQAEHLLYPYVGWLWFEAWRFFGYRDGALIPLQLLSAVFGALGVAAFFLTCRLVLAGVPRAGFVSVAAALLLASAYGYWFHSTEGEDQIISTAFLLVAVLCLAVWSRLEQPDGAPKAVADRRRWLLGAALAAAAAILLHATAVLAVPALAYLAWAGRPRRHDWLAAGSTLAGAIAVAYAVVGFGIRRLWTPASWLGWLFAAPAVGVWGQLQLHNLWVGAQTVVGSLVHLEGGVPIRAIATGAIAWRDVLDLAVVLAVGGVAGCALFQIARGGRPGPSAQHRQPPLATPSSPIVRFCGLWLIPTWLFAIAWAPEDVQFFVNGLPPAILLVCLGIVNLVVGRPRLEEMLSSLLAFGVTAVFVINLATAMLPRADATRNLGYLRTLCLRAQTRPADLIITPGWDWASSYVPYFAGRSTLSLIDSYLGEADRDPARLFAIVRARIDETQARGGRAYVVRLFALPAADQAYLSRVTGLTPAGFPFPTRQAGQCLGEPFWEVTP